MSFLQYFYHICVVCLWQTRTLSCKRTSEYENKLYADLFDIAGYNAHGLPVRTVGTKVTMEILFSLYQLSDLNEKENSLEIQGALIQEFQNEYLIWNPEDYGGIETIFPRLTDLWLPDLVLYNSLQENMFNMVDSGHAEVLFDGTVNWRNTVRFKLRCHVNLKFFPFDQQLCRLQFASWTYSGFDVDVYHKWDKVNGSYGNGLVQKAIDMSEFQAHSNWVVLDDLTTSKRVVVYYPCCKNTPYPSLFFNITLKRRPLYFVVHVLFPASTLSILSAVAFVVPPGCGERVSLSITVLLSQVFFQIILMQTLPNTSIQLSILQTFVTFTMVMLFLATMCSVLVLNLHYRRSSVLHLPSSINALVLKYLAKLVCFDVGSMTAHTFDESDDDKHSGDPGSLYTKGSCHQSELSIIYQQIASVTPTFGEEINDWELVAAVVNRLIAVVYFLVCFIGILLIFCGV